MAADIGIVQGATLALFYAFSANARSLILSKASIIPAHSVMIGRLLLLIPLSAICYWLSVVIAGVDQLLAVILILRRGIEWLGEVHLSEAERLQDYGNARKYLIIQSILLAMAMGWLIFGLPFPMLGLFLWAFLPLFFSAKFIVHSVVKVRQTSANILSKILPHLGSTAIIGITVYVFRLLLLLLMGKEIAGDLYTAFAIGGLTGSVFANALGASIALHEQRIGKRYFPTKLRQALVLAFMFGLLIFISAFLQLPYLEVFGKSYFFWEATGLSLLGGVIMVFAQRIRFRILQSDEEKDVFGPDVMMNLLLLATMPFAFYLIGREFLGALYLLSAVFAYIFYSSSMGEGVLRRCSVLSRDKVRLLIAIALLFPLYFQVSSGIFRDPSFTFNSGGRLAELPIPLSVLACFGGIVLLGEYRRAFVSYMVIFLTCVLMVMTSIVSTSGDLEYQEAKLVLLMQFILPMFALALGQAFNSERGDKRRYLGKAFLLVVMVIVPLQLLASWYQGISILAPSVWLFSVYQQLQYVPVIMVSAYLVALFVFWQTPKYRLGLLMLTCVMSIYVAASTSMLAIGLLMIGILVLILFQWTHEKDKIPLLAFLFAAILIWGYLQHEKEAVSFKFGVKNVNSELSVPNLTSRMDYWKYYLTAVSSGPKSFLVGQDTAPDRAKYPSAHNYYLDFLYNFGFLALLPTLALLGVTVLLIYRHWKRILMARELLGLCLVVMFLLLVDNSLKVGLRQPYPGIFTFFLWGVLLSRLFVLSADRKKIET